MSCLLPALQNFLRNQPSGVAPLQDRDKPTQGMPVGVASRRGTLDGMVDWSVWKAPARMEGHPLERFRSASVPKYGFANIVLYVISNIFISAGYRLQNCKPVPVSDSPGYMDVIGRHHIVIWSYGSLVFPLSPLCILSLSPSISNVYTLLLHTFGSTTCSKTATNSRMSFSRLFSFLHFFFSH